ncbi:unnamed protein product [Clonostachys rosea]|uniref:EKC/KEOPS complex subunit BUD32 n=1 Tax=Bionectria ochroleuca TaxID=29856 RepID=A0ABY6UBH3_BIOOC|nr:unnamed protein product [Clonostachys rosea]
MADSSLELAPSNPDNYEIRTSLKNNSSSSWSTCTGYGRYSDVFEGVNVQTALRCAIKSLKTTRDDHIRREIKVLEALRGGVNIITLLDIVTGDQDRPTSLVFELADHVDFRSLYPRFSSADVRFYTRELLRALEFAHDKGVMHRDVRPHNVLIDPAERRLRLIDWGSAEFYEPRTEYTVRVGRAFFKAPELLLHHGEYDYGVDMWQVGAMLAGMVFRREPFFHGASSADMLGRMARVLGTSGLRNYVERYDMEMADVDDIAVHPRRPWGEFVNDDNRHLAEEDAIDLLDKLLRWDHKVGLTLQGVVSKGLLCPLLTMMSLGPAKRKAGDRASLLPRGR